MITATVSGSFHRHMEAITRTVHELAAHGVRVLSPADPRVVAAQGEFLFVASDRVRSVRLVQDRHLECIRASSFLWLVCPDGYVGQSASMEIGYAAGAGVPIFCSSAPQDLTLREYISVVRSVEDAIRKVARQDQGVSKQSDGFLIDPNATIEVAQKLLQRMNALFKQPMNGIDPSRELYGGAEKLKQLLSFPTSIQ